MKRTPSPTGITRVASPFKQIEAISMADRVVAALKNAFFAGDLKPGDAIVERQLAQQMGVGTPVVREALISLQGQGFVRRVTNTGTYVTRFAPDEVRQLYLLRIEFETLAFQWARSRVTESEIKELESLANLLVEAGERNDRRAFLERDFNFHKRCWQLSGNVFLAETLERLMAPLFAFVVLESDAPLTAAMAREHFELIDALRSLREPEFTAAVRNRITGFAMRWIGFTPHSKPEERNASLNPAPAPRESEEARS